MGALPPKAALSISKPSHSRVPPLSLAHPSAFCISITSTKGFPSSPGGKESASNAGDPGLIPGSGRSPGEGNRYRLQYSGLENPMDSIVHGVAKSKTRRSDFHFSLFTSTKKLARQGLLPWCWGSPWPSPEL